MSQRRKLGERVWIWSRGAPIRVRIASCSVLSTHVDPRQVCDDSRCVEWAVVRTDDGRPFYHVPEHDMHDTEQIAERVAKKRA